MVLSVLTGSSAPSETCPQQLSSTTSERRQVRRGAENVGFLTGKD